MRERPILFSVPMVRAIHPVQIKTQTRRIVKLWNGSLPEDEDIKRHMDGAFEVVMDFTKRYPYWEALHCPYGGVGDRLWVRETWAQVTGPVAGETAEEFGRKGIIYRADEGNDSRALKGIWKPSIHMFRWMSRITLEITGIRVERLHDITEADAIAEGIYAWHWDGDVSSFVAANRHLAPAVLKYALLWESINGPGSWDANPYVWAIEFRKVVAL